MKGPTYGYAGFVLAVVICAHAAITGTSTLQRVLAAVWGLCCAALPFWIAKQRRRREADEALWRAHIEADIAAIRALFPK